MVAKFARSQGIAKQYNNAMARIAAMFAREKHYGLRRVP